MNNEIEFEVSDPDEFMRFSESLGYQVYVRKEKIGWYYTYQDLTIGIWEVTPLGWFIEVERLIESAAEEEVEAARSLVIKLLERLGIKTEAHEPRYYMEMLLG